MIFSSSQDREAALVALAIQQPASARAVFLQAVCGNDQGLRQRLEALLAAHEQPETLTSARADNVEATVKLDFSDAPDEGVGTTLGRYKLLELIGEGGCGVVYVAEQTEPVRRRVALKVIKLGMDTRQVVARFEAERQALAMMDHPNIAKVLDAGTTEFGRPYFVMELVRGIRITEYCDQANLTTKERLDLFIKVCQATRLLVTNLPGHEAGAMPVGFLAGERTLVSVNNQGVIDQWDTASWHKRSSATFPSGTSPELAALSDAPNTGFLLLRPNGRDMVGSLSWWKLSDSREEARLQAHKNGSLVEPAVSPDGRLIATAASESEVKLWSAATHTPVAVLPGHLLGVHSVAFSADGDRLASGSDGREAVKLWDVAIQQDVATIAGSGSLFGFIRFSPDGNLVLAINIDQQVHVWRAPSWSEIAAAEAKEKVEVEQP